MSQMANAILGRLVREEYEQAVEDDREIEAADMVSFVADRILECETLATMIRLIYDRHGSEPFDPETMFQNGHLHKKRGALLGWGLCHRHSYDWGQWKLSPASIRLVEGLCKG